MRAEEQDARVGDLRRPISLEARALIVKVTVERKEEIELASLP